MKQLTEKDAVRYWDSQGREHKALVTAIHGTYGYSCGTVKREDGSEFDAGHPSINVVYVTPEVGKTDSWGLQLERNSSVVHADSQGAGGNYWKFDD